MTKFIERIDVDINSFDPKITDFLNFELQKCRDNHISIHMPKTKTVIHANNHCGGYVDSSDQPVLAVACGKSIKTWLLIFIHETCHLDQYLEKSPIWDVTLNGVSATDLMDSWLNKSIELTEAELKIVFDNIIELESDCERRSVEKIKQWSLPIKIDTYIRKSNAYVWSYRLIQETRNWEHSAMYTYGPVWRAMPKLFPTHYNDLPGTIRNAFYEHIDRSSCL